MDRSRLLQESVARSIIMNLAGIRVADEVLYTGLIEMQELDAPGKGPRYTRPHPNYIK